MVLQVIEQTVSSSSTFAKSREAVRSHIVDDWAVRIYPTVLGTIIFDANGDIDDPELAYHYADSSLNSGAPCWSIYSQQAVRP